MSYIFHPYVRLPEGTPLMFHNSSYLYVVVSYRSPMDKSSWQKSSIYEVGKPQWRFLVYDPCDYSNYIKYNIILYHIISYHTYIYIHIYCILFDHITWVYNIFHNNWLYHIISYHIKSYHIISYHIVLYYLLFHHITFHS